MTEKLMIQSDFDGTLITEDVSVILLDHFTDRKWRVLYDDYVNGRITLDDFNYTAFHMVKASEEEFIGYARQFMKPRPGVKELIETCKEMGIRFHIVSNGLLDYIQAFLSDLGEPDTEAKAALATYEPDGMNSWYENPKGKKILTGFKSSYTKLFRSEGYKIIYLGDGISDYEPSMKCDVVFARDDLLKKYQSRKRMKKGLEVNELRDLHDVISYLKS